MRQIEYYATFELIDYVFRYNFKDLHIYIQNFLAYLEAMGTQAVKE